MKDEYLTIAEFAKQAGVTKQAIYLRLNKDLKPYLKEVEGVKCLNIQALKLYGTRPIDQDPSRTLIDLAAYLEGQNKKFDRLIDVLEADVAKLHQEIDVKNKQIAEKDQQIEEVLEKLDQEQKLHAMMQRTHAHALLNGSRQDPDPSPVDQDEIDAAYEKGKADAQKQMVRIAKALSRNYPDAADFLIAEFDKKD